jgi:2'-5' RNA ligase
VAAAGAAGALTGQSAVIVRTSLPVGLEGLGRESVTDAAVGVPAHLTLLYPFVDPSELTLAIRRRLGRVARRHASFAYTLLGIAVWPDTVYVAVEPTAPFQRLQRDCQAAFPAYPIYGRDATFRFVPHVTVAEGSAVPDPAVAAHPGWRALPRAREATAIEVIASGMDGRWRTVWRIRLGERDRAVDRMPA